MIAAVNVTVLGVADLDRSTRFYVEDLGCSPVRMTEPVPGRHWHELGFDGGGTRLALLNADGWQVPPRPGPALTLTCADVASTVADLRGRDVEVSGPVETPWGLSAQLTDPDGHVLILGEAGPGSAP
ncbi:VOC family protein [Microlunatus lacustris]